VEGAAALTEALPKEGLFSVIEENFGAIILAGGRGTRLGVQGPKGCVEVEGKSLFEHLLSKARDPRLWVAIMTSPDNHEETKRFLQAHDWFGVDPSHIDLFVQSTAPVLSRDGRWLEQETPSGNGAIFHTFREHGLLQKWKNLGISAVNILPIDNPKADPADTTCFALPEELVVKVVAQISPEEKVGRMVTKSGRLLVQEYFELSPEQKEAGAFCYAGMFSCSLSFLERAASLKLPWHLVQKDNHFQFETFIFDAFSVARSFSLVHYPRSLFVPIKSMADLQAKG
jgi:UDP-N-acetylglucosamine pyrophosphorylase